MSAVVVTKPEYRQVKKLVDAVMAIAGVFVLGYVADSIARHWRQFDELGAFRQLALPVWLTLGVLPLLYAFSLLVNYEMAFLRCGWSGGDRRSVRRTKLALLFTLNVRTHAVAALNGEWFSRLGNATTFGEALAIAKEYRDSLESGG
jgi:hypothetical protein